MGNSSGFEKCKKVISGEEAGVCETKYLSHPVIGFKKIRCETTLKTPDNAAYIATIQINPSENGKIIRPGDNFNIASELRTDEYKIVKIDGINSHGDVNSFTKCFSSYDYDYRYKKGNTYTERNLDCSLRQHQRGLYFYTNTENLKDV